MEKYTEQNDFSIRNIVSGIFRQKQIVIIVAPVIIIVVFLVLLIQTPVFEASVKMHIVGQSQVTSEFYYDIGARGLHRTQMAIVKSNPVIKRAVLALKLDKRPLDYEKKFCHPIKNFLIEYKTKKLTEKLNLLTPEEQRQFFINFAMKFLKENITTDLIPGTDLFEIRISDYSPENAVAIANVVSRSYVIFDLQQQLAELTQKYGLQHPSVRQLRDNIYTMTEKLSGEQLSELEAYGTAKVKIIEQAFSNNQAMGKSKMLVFLAAIFGAMAAGIGLAFAYDMFLDQTFKSPNEIVKYTGLPLLGSIPVKKNKDKMLLDIDAFNPNKSEQKYSDFFDDLSDQLLIYMKVNQQKTILITSAFPKGGATITSANISLCLSHKMGIRTLLVDANFRNPMIHKLFNIPEGAGLANMLEEGKLIEYHAIHDSNNETVKDIAQDNYNDSSSEKTLSNNISSRIEKIKLSEIIYQVDSKLNILQAGKASMSPLTLLNDSKLDALLKVLKADYDAVIIDTTNLKNYKDPGLLSSHVDGIALIVNDGREKRQIVMNSISYIRQKKGNPIGFILNRRRFPIPGFIYKWI
ncbi:MAG: hypothetical protein JW864_10170 [Spirochaetes bacterium]|nr:hypothetical protein [Spirochaetota bacterium]